MVGIAIRKRGRISALGGNMISVLGKLPTVREVKL